MEFTLRQAMGLVLLPLLQSMLFLVFTLFSLVVALLLPVWYLWVSFFLTFKKFELSKIYLRGVLLRELSTRSKYKSEFITPIIILLYGCILAI